MGLRAHSVCTLRMLWHPVTCLVLWGTRGAAQVVDRTPSMHKALVSTTSTKQKQNQTQTRALAHLSQVG